MRVKWCADLGKVSTCVKSQGRPGQLQNPELKGRLSACWLSCVNEVFLNQEKHYFAKFSESAQALSPPQSPLSSSITWGKSDGYFQILTCKSQSRPMFTNK